MPVCVCILRDEWRRACLLAHTAANATELGGGMSGKNTRLCISCVCASMRARVVVGNIIFI